MVKNCKHEVCSNSTIISQGESGKRMFSKDNNIFMKCKSFLCNFGNIFNAMKPIFNEFFSNEIFHLYP